MTRIVPASAALIAIVAAATVSLAQNRTGEITIQRDPGCGCCLKWVSHLQQAGFKTTVTESPDMAKIKDSKGVPETVRSCHTGTIEGYVIEGHVPAADIKRLLKEKPAVVGIAVPGMPSGSPGMEVPGGRVDPYNVVTFDKSGKTRVFASYP